MSAARPTPPDEPPNTILGGGEEPSAPDGPVSPRLSFKGWLFSVWLRKNKGFVKTILTLVATSAGASPALNLPTLKTALVALGIGALAIFLKMVADSLDYFFTDGPQ